MITDPIAMNEHFTQLRDVVVLGIEDPGSGPFRAHVETVARVHGCPRCGTVARAKGRRIVELCDLPLYGRPSRLVWHKRRFSCLEQDCPMRTWTEEDARIAAPRLSMTDRLGRWATRQVGKWGRSVNEVARDLGCEWHTINDAVIAYGAALVEDPDRFGDVEALGLDEVLFVRRGEWHRKEFTTSIVDVERGQLLDIVPGRTGTEPKTWLAARGAAWRAKVHYTTLDLSGPYRAVFNEMLPDATQIADPFHVIRVATAKLDECRRRVQNEVFGHRGRKNDPLYRARRLLTMAQERLGEHGTDKMLGLLRVGDPRGDVTASHHAKEAVRELYAHADEQLAAEWIDQLITDMSDETWPTEVRSLGRTLKSWRNEIIAWHRAHFTNGPTEAMNNLIKRVKRVAFGFTSFRNYRIRSLLYAGKPNWDLLATVTPH